LCVCVCVCVCVCINCVYFLFFGFSLNVWVLLPFHGEIKIKMYISGGIRISTATDK